MKIEEVYKHMGYDVDKHMELSNIIHEKTKEKGYKWFQANIELNKSKNLLYVDLLLQDNAWESFEIDNNKLQYTTGKESTTTVLNKDILIDDDNFYDIKTYSSTYNECILVTKTDLPEVNFLFDIDGEYVLLFVKEEALVDIKMNNLSINFNLIDNL